MARKFWLALGCLFVMGAPAVAQEGVLSELYGKGVHSYFDNRPAQALDYLNTAVESGSGDPRVFYYRGLAFLLLGDEFSAEADFTHAAGLEVADTNEFYDVNRAIERIQGSTRHKIEAYRLSSRVEALRRSKQLEYERYERIREAEPNVTIPPEPQDPILPPVAEPAVEEPEELIDEPAMDEPADDMPAEDAEDDPAMEEPAEDEPALDEPAIDEPADDEPAMEEPIEDADVPFEDAPQIDPADEVPVEDPLAKPDADAPEEADDAPSASTSRENSSRRVAHGSTKLQELWRRTVYAGPAVHHVVQK